jgi:hypothetical protein
VVAPLTGAGALALAAAVLIAVVSSRVPPAPSVAGAERSSVAVTQAVKVARPLPEAERAALITAPWPVATPRGAAHALVPPPPRAARPARALASMRSAATATHSDPPARAQLADVAEEVEHEMQVVRSGGVDLRPTLASPLAGASPLPADAPPRRIWLRGPGDPAAELERALDAEPVFVRPIALR